MRLGFDARYIRTDHHDGISRFSTELAAAVWDEAGRRPDDEVVFLIHDPAQRALLPAGVPTLMLHAPTSWREPFASLRVRDAGFDAVFSPMQTFGSFGHRGRFRLVLSLHDLIYYRHRTPPRELAWPIRLGWRLFYLTRLPQRLTLDAADAVVTVSETSRRQIAQARLTRRPLWVVANAPQATGTRADRSVWSETAPLDLVYMGSFMGYKDVETLVRAQRRLGEATRLHLLSRISPERERELARLAGGADVVFHHGVSDAVYTRLLTGNALLVTASRDEGYGLPIAEALALGTPAVVTDLEIFHEVAGDGARYAPAGDDAAFAQAIRSLRPVATRRRLADAGLARMARHTWRDSAVTLLDRLEELTATPPRATRR
jgi:glycosyltransferase involved in cell wall biosynthesis